MDKKVVMSFAIVIAFIFFLFNISRPKLNINYVELPGVKIKVELALTPEERVRGLSGRSGLNEFEGMLFIFDQVGPHSFWMKDMRFPIDIIWLDDNSKIIYIKKNALPELYPEAYGPAENAKYVLEVVSGFSEKNDIKLGDRAIFSE